MLRIVYLNDGNSLYDHFFLSYLSKIYDVTLLTFNRNIKYLPDGVDFIQMPDIGKLPVRDGIRILFFTQFRILMLKRYLNSLKPDLVITGPPRFYGFYCALSGYRPYILLVWANAYNLLRGFPQPLRFMAKYALKRADAVIVDNKSKLKACVKIGCDINHIISFPWFDFDSIVRKKRANGTYKIEFKQILEWNKNDPIIICTRSHEPIYDMKSFIEAIPLVLKKVTNARFLIIGQGSQTEKLKERVLQLGITQNIVFMGHLPHDQLIRILSVSDIYVSTSLADGTSASLLEAMVCRIPVVVTDIPGNREWIRDGHNGRLIPVKSPQMLAEEIVRLLENDDLRESLTTKAYETVKEMANWQKNSEILKNLISCLSY